MSTTATDRLIAPHGGALVDRTGDAPGDLETLEVVALTSRELSDLDGAIGQQLAGQHSAANGRQESTEPTS